MLLRLVKQELVMLLVLVFLVILAKQVVLLDLLGLLTIGTEDPGGLKRTGGSAGLGGLRDMTQQFVEKTMQEAAPMPHFPADFKKSNIEIGLRFRPSGLL